MVSQGVDSYLNDSQGLAITRDHVYDALDSAAGAKVTEGCVGAATCMQLFDFKGGIGTSSRIVQVAKTPYTIGALVLTNFGSRHELRVDGVAVGRMLAEELPRGGTSEGSCIVVLATDAPLNARQCERLAKRAALGLARTGSTARDGSGEIIVAFATGNLIRGKAAAEISVHTLVEGPSAAGTSPLNDLFTGA